MSSRKAVVQRRYQIQDEACEQAVELLLERPVKTVAGHSHKEGRCHVSKPMNYQESRITDLRK